MGRDKKPTKDQHYIPQVYLRNFSPDSKKEVGRDKMRIFRLPLDKIMDWNEKVRIKSQAYEKYLYEVYDNEDNMISINYIENCLCNLENDFGLYVGKLLDRIDSGKISKIPEEEREFWELYTSLQMARTPKVIEATKIYTEDNLGDRLSKQECAALAMMTIFPFFSDIDGINEDYISWNSKRLQDRIMCFGIDSSDSIFTSDNPVCGFIDDWDSKNISGVIFPIASNCVLLFLDPANTPKERNNSILYLSKEQIKYIKERIIINAKTCLYSKNAFQEDELQFIYDIHNNLEKTEAL